MSSREKHKVFVVKDEKSEVYGYPIVMPNKGFFLRDLYDKVNSNQSMMSRHPQDFSIFEIGEFDVELGVMVPYETKNCLGLVQDLIPKQ